MGGGGVLAMLKCGRREGGGAQQVLNVIFGLLTTKFNTKTKPFHFLKSTCDIGGRTFRAN